MSSIRVVTFTSNVDHLNSEKYHDIETSLVTHGVIYFV